MSSEISRLLDKHEIYAHVLTGAVLLSFFVLLFDVEYLKEALARSLQMESFLVLVGIFLGFGLGFSGFVAEHLLYSFGKLSKISNMSGEDLSLFHFFINTTCSLLLLLIFWLITHGREFTNVQSPFLAGGISVVGLIGFSIATWQFYNKMGKSNKIPKHVG
jgi:hypothetical protein